MATEKQSASGAQRNWPRRSKYHLLLLVVLAVVIVVRVAVVPRLGTGASATVLATLYLVAALAAVALSIRAVIETVRSHREHTAERTTDG